jgi:two-component system, NarL family, response regulator DegU
MTEIRIVIADDHPIFRKGLRSTIEADAKLKIVAEAEDGEQALDLIQTLKPDIAILDMEMPNKSGFEVIQEVREKKSPVAVIFLTMHKDERFFNAALDHGAKGYVLKESAVNDIIASIKAVASGDNFISPQLSTYLLDRRSKAASLKEQKPGLDNLTPTERQVLRLIAANKTSKEIADGLCISSRTVEKHRANISEKLELHGSHALLNFALEHKSELS